MFKGVLFDLDGVIADTSTLHFEAWKKLVYTYFSVTLPDSIEEKTKGVSRTDSLKVILESLDVVVSDSMIQQLLQEKNEWYCNSLNTLSSSNILPGIAPFISELKEQKMKLALASASLNGPLILEKLALSTAFDAVVDPSKVAHGKPAPDIFIAAAEAPGLTPTAWVGIADSVAGVSAINSSGAFSIAVGKNPQLQSTDLILPSTAELRLDTLRIAYSN